MTVLAIIVWSAIAATVAWRLAIRRTAVTIAAMRAQAEQEIRHWQDLAARERLRAGQLERELTSWSEGCRQGREDVVNIVPMLLAANGRQACLCHSGADASQ
jgi:hypothetical protein